MKQVFVILINYKGDKDTIDCLESLRKTKKADFLLHVLLVDNFPPQPIEIDENKYKDIDLRVIYSSKNLGFTGGNNLGIQRALSERADYVLILNNDTFVDQNLLSELVKTAESNSKIGMVVPKIYFAKGFEFHKNRYSEEDLGRVIWYAGGIIDWKNVFAIHRGVDEVDRGQFNSEEETESASGNCFLIKSETLKSTGAFDDKYFLYYEDADLSQRVKKAGFKIVYNPKAMLWHKNARSTGGSGSPLQDYYITRNRLLFGMKFAPARAKFSLFREAIKILLAGRVWQKRGALDFFIGKMGKGSYTL